MKQVILVRNDLKLPKGKLGAQTAHASVDAVLKLLKKDKKKVERWRREGMAKIVVKVKDKKELYEYISKAKAEGIITSIISDAGKTTVSPGTITCGAVGPDVEEKIDKITGGLKLL